MIKIYHNPRCSKSRQGVAFLEEQNKKFEIIKYLEDVPTIEELSQIISFLNILPIQLVRKTEKTWKENYKGKQLSDIEIITAMIDNPKLIERPIIVKGNKAVIGRPTENINTLF